MTQVFDRPDNFEPTADLHRNSERTALTVIRVSREEQLRGYGPESQWEEDVLPNAALLGIVVTERYRRAIEEPASGWNRPKFEEVIREAIHLHQAGLIGVILFPRVDRETRFLFASFPILRNHPRITTHYLTRITGKWEPSEA